MDTYGNGIAVKKEFMKGHEAKLGRMKGPDGMISLKDMAARDENMKEQGN